MASPAYPANNSSDWILRRNVNISETSFTVDYFTPIVAQHVAVIRFDKIKLALLEVEVYGRL